MFIRRTAAHQIVALTGILSAVIVTGWLVPPKCSALSNYLTPSVTLACIVLGVTILVREGYRRQGAHTSVSVNEVMLWNVFFVSGTAAIVSTALLNFQSSLAFIAVAGVSMLALFLVRLVDRR